MHKLSFIQIEKGNNYHYKLAEKLWIPFSEELDEHEGISETREEILHDLTRRINIQGNRDNMHFELLLKENTPIGIAMFAIDTGTVYGLLESGYGVITGFYIRPEYRMKGYGRKFFEHIENVLINDGAPKIYLTPDGVTGEPFWVSLGFENSGKFDPDDKKYIYIKDCKGKMKNIKIIEVNESDARFLHELMNNKDIITVLNEVPTTTDVWADAIIKWKHDADEEDYIIFYEATPIGWLGINGLSAEDKRIYIKMIALLPEYQNIGIGQYVIKKLVKKLKKRGYSSVALYTDKSNIKAQRCYLKCGFGVTSEVEQKMSNGMVVTRCKMECFFHNSIFFRAVNSNNYTEFIELMLNYAKELDEHQGRNTNPEILKKWTESIVEKQFEDGRYLKLCSCNSEIVGFLYGKIDKADDNGFKKIGYGCIMEFYVIPGYRRKGFGKAMYLEIESFFRKNGVTHMYLTADPVTGKPFWEKMGFTATGEVSPDNNQKVYEKELI